jgi:hypothetical protein
VPAYSCADRYIANGCGDRQVSLVSKIAGAPDADFLRSSGCLSAAATRHVTANYAETSAASLPIPDQRPSYWSAAAGVADIAQVFIGQADHAAALNGRVLVQGVGRPGHRRLDGG